MTPEEVIVESANTAVRNGGADPDFLKLIKHMLTLTAGDIEGALGPDDVAGLFMPVEVVEGGKDRLGAILLLTDRAVLAWTVGTFRMKNFKEVISYANVQLVEPGIRPGGSVTKDRHTLRIGADGPIRDLVFSNFGEGAIPYVSGLLDGSMKIDASTA